MGQKEAEDKQKIIEFLKGFEGVATNAEIAKSTGIDRNTLKNLLKELESEGKIKGAGRAAGVFGYKIVT